MAVRGQVAIVTGAARGIGRAVAARLADAGARVALVDLDGTGAAAAAADLTRAGYEALGCAADVGDADQVRAMVAQVVGHWGPPRILVNNAGISDFGSIFDQEAEARWHRVLSTNLTGPYLCARSVAPLMRDAGGGAIINMASTRAYQSEPDTEAYAASKGGLLALTHALAVSLGPLGIRVNCISPGWIHTQPQQPLRPEDHSQHPVGRVGRPEDVAAACLFLADPEQSGFMTGQNLVLDGGMTVKMQYIE